MIDAERLAGLSLFADLSHAELAAVAEEMEEESFSRGARVLREGIGGGGFYVITDGSASVVIGGRERALLHAGEFFGEVSVLTGERPGADVVAASDELRCALLGGPRLRPFLLEHPGVALRMLEAMARRLRAANLWSE